MYIAQLLPAQTHIAACGCLQTEHANVDSTLAGAAAPLMMTGVQFAIQNLLARLVIKAGIVQRTAAAVELDWRQYMQQGEHQSCIVHSQHSWAGLHMFRKEVAKDSVCRHALDISQQLLLPPETFKLVSTSKLVCRMSPWKSANRCALHCNKALP